MAKFIVIHPDNEEFVGLMKTLAKAVRTGDSKLADKAKKEFAEADISIFYNNEEDIIRVVRKDCPFVDFPLSTFE